jgi:DNA-3-methyladenine glycosylase II
MTYEAHLSRDRTLRRLIAAHGPVQLGKRKDVCYMLCASIMSQQLATAVARTIKGRFLDLFGGRPPGPAEILRKRPATLRAIGLSGAKASYIRNVAEFSLEHGLDHRVLGRMEDEAAIEYLTRIKGVGRWTAEMILMFTLGREDVFSAGDGGIRGAMVSLYGLDPADRAIGTSMTAIAERWRPYRTYACLYLWKHKDTPKPQPKRGGKKAEPRRPRRVR